MELEAYRLLLIGGKGTDRGQYRAREGASRIAPASTVAAAAATVGFLLWGVAAIFGTANYADTITSMRSALAELD